MSDASLTPKLGPPRLMSAEELALVKKMLSHAKLREDQRLAETLVRDMPDGGMGSIQFCSGSAAHRRLGKEIAEGAFSDADGTPVSVTLNLDEQGELFELDVFKADFSPLIRYPDPKDFKIIERHGKLGFPPAD